MQIAARTSLFRPLLMNVTLNLQDLKPLEECKELEGVVLPAKYGDIEFFRKMPKLKFLTAEPRSEPWWLAQQPAAAFWKKLDEGKQK